MYMMVVLLLLPRDVKMMVMLRVMVMRVQWLMRKRLNVRYVAHHVADIEPSRYKRCYVQHAVVIV